MDNRQCFMCKTTLSSKAKPTMYEAVKYHRTGAPKYLYLCAKCANKCAPTLKSLLSNYERAFHRINDE